MIGRGPGAEGSTRPRLDPSTVLPANVPKFISDGDERLARLFTRPGRFPELTGANLVGQYERVRARRPERRQSWTLVTRALWRRMDRRTWRCGAPREDRRDTVDAPLIAELAAECDVSRSTVNRVLAELHDAKYLESHRVVMDYVGDDGPAVRGLPSVRLFTRKFFRRLGFSDRKIARTQANGAHQWRQRRAPAISPAKAKAARRQLRAELARIKSAHAARPPAPAAPGVAWRSDEVGADWTLERARLRELHPDWGEAQIADTARRNLRP